MGHRFRRRTILSTISVMLAVPVLAACVGAASTPTAEPTATQPAPTATAPPAGPTATPTGTTEPTPELNAGEGMELPTPQPVGGIDGEGPPPAWLIVGDEAYPATYGSFCFGPQCVDMVPPQMMPELATAELPAGQQAVIRVATGQLREFNVTVASWTTEPAMGEQETTKVPVQGDQGDEATVFVLEPLESGGDQLLIATAQFSKGDAMYIWRLNPGK